MSKFRWLALVAPAVFLIAVAQSAAAGGPTTVTHQSFSETVTWALPASQCTQLEADLSGVGERKMQIITQTAADGTQTVRINDLVTGTATDTAGGTYKFVYHNSSSDTAAGGGSTHDVQMVDSFVLNGQGSAKLNIGFNWRWSYTGAFSFPPFVDNWVLVSTRGDVACDPI